MKTATISSLWLGSWLPAALAEMVTHDHNFHPDHILRVTEAQVPLSCESRTDILVNGTSPGPALHILPGTSSWIRVYNDMPDQNLTMHWHGLTQRMAPFADGTPLASQWPIPPGHFFDYEIATNNDDAGTYFYHSHVGIQAISCTGPLIVDDCGSSPYHYDDERILHFQDFFQKSDQEMMSDVTKGPFKWAGEIHGVLLNGKGVATGQQASVGPSGGGRGFFGGRLGGRPDGFGGNFRHHGGDYDDQSDSKGCDSKSDDTSSDDSNQAQVEITAGCTLPVIDVEPGKTYRFRFIGANGLSFLTMGLEDHDDLTIIQVDGSEYNAPVKTDRLNIGAGQRFDVLFKAKTIDELEKNGNKSTFYLQFETLERPEPYTGYGVVRYDQSTPIPTAPANKVLDLPRDPTNWMEYTFTSLFPEQNEAPSASEVTRRIIIDAEQKQENATGKVVWELAHLSWTEHTYTSPLLVDIYQYGDAALPNWEAAQSNWGWDPKTKSFPCKLGEVIEIVFQNTGSELGGIVETHPFHAHSKHYYDIGSGPGKYDAEANNKKLEQTGYKAVRRDTTMLYRYDEQVGVGEPAGWRAWRLKITDAGVWMIHCHILSHMMMGMQSVWTMGDAEQIRKLPPTAISGYMTYGGSVYGNSTHAPRLYQYFNGTNQCRPVEKKERIRVY
ncbi:Ascorbate oxidase (AO)-like protein [Podospora bellae-mahoneyi]|uniref:Ascorbate oxidase (AO)-like protein n=1 Tax=Podospora bellae-mahoneyi TaxID=2093777 RepID=A0ABR0FKB9_9PEZI|nr:Ascorbate oxidase (AO)-like protein [Podospora bellae-mahoneyi]